MRKSEIIEYLKTKSVYQLGRKLRPKSTLKEKSLTAWTVCWLKRNKIAYPKQTRGPKPIFVPLEPDVYCGGGVEPK